MGYYIRVLGNKVSNSPLDQLREAARPALLNVSEGEGDEWAQLTLLHKTGREIAVVGPRLRACVERLTDEQIWWRPNEFSF